MQKTQLFILLAIALVVLVLIYSHRRISSQFEFPLKSLIERKQEKKVNTDEINVKILKLLTTNQPTTREMHSSTRSSTTSQLPASNQPATTIASQLANVLQIPNVFNHIYSNNV
jgi:hypothetical protein